MESISIQYIAGFFDGEGCVSVSLNKTPKNSQTIYRIHLSVAQKTPEVIRAFRGFGSVYQTKAGIWRWEIGGSGQCIKVIETMHPYLIVKANVALDLLERVVNRAGRDGAAGALSSDELWARQELVDKIHLLNSKAWRAIQ